MNGLNRRELYARWDQDRTKSLIRSVLTDLPLREKMVSLIDKHHDKTRPTSHHLHYGTMKDYAERIGLSREDSRAISIKLINIVKSFKSKKGLKRLFFQGWDTYDRIVARGDPAGHARGAKAKPGRAAQTTLDNDKALLESIIENINLKVLTFTRAPNAKRITKGSKSAPGERGKRKRGTPTTQPERLMLSTDLAMGQADSPQADWSRNHSLDLQGEDLSRASYSVAERRSQSNADQASVVSLDTSRHLQACQLQILEMPSDVERRHLQIIFDQHVAILNDRSRTMKPEVKEFIMKFMSDALAQRARHPSRPSHS